MRILLSIIFFHILGQVFTQETVLYPDEFSSYTLNLGWENPSYIPDEGLVRINGQSKLRTGAFKKVSSYLLSGEIIRDKKQKDVFRVQVISEKEGAYISRPRVYANYALAIPVSDNESIAFGVAIGAVGVTYSASGVSGSGSGIQPDASVGLSFNWKSGLLGFSGMQLLNSSFEPSASIVTFSRYYSTIFQQQFKLNSEWVLTTDALLSVKPNSTNRYDLQLKGTYQEYVSIGALMRWNQHLSFLGQFNVAGENNDLLVSFFYNVPVFKETDTQVVSFEICLGFMVK